ncbi:MAG: 16S rRNA (guanine(527)-N(7))-methyltransferase RsmG [Chitinophagaceae bacterium]
MEKTEKQLELVTKYFADFTPTQLEQFQALLPLYKEWNEKINVISRKDIDSLYLHHVLHSLSIAAVIQFQPGTKVLDIGTGGGFPGIPLAIFFPDVQFHLVDSIGKKLKVVQAVANAIELKNVTVQHTRIEDIVNRKFQFAVSRAVAPLGELWKWCHKLLHKADQQDLPNGLICLKGGDLAQEIFESGLKPGVVHIQSLFPETYFDQKYVLHVAR